MTLKIDSNRRVLPQSYLAACAAFVCIWGMGIVLATGLPLVAVFGYLAAFACLIRATVIAARRSERLCS